MQKITTLGNIQSVDLRDCWEYEDKDFTPWLTQEENIKLLGDTIDMDLEVESQEVNVTHSVPTSFARKVEVA